MTLCFTPFYKHKKKKHLITEKLLGTYNEVPQINRSGNLHGNRNGHYCEISRLVKGLSMNITDDTIQLRECPNYLNHLEGTTKNLANKLFK